MLHHTKKMDDGRTYAAKLHSLRQIMKSNAAESNNFCCTCNIKVVHDGH